MRIRRKLVPVDGPVGIVVVAGRYRWLVVHL
jgi:hypothetical protein